MMKRVLTFLLAALMLLSLAACGGNNASGGDDGMYYFGDKKDWIKQVKEVERTLDPQQVYASIEYDEMMLYGSYDHDNWDAERKNFAKNATYQEVEYSVTYSSEPETRTEMLSTLPTSFVAGYCSVYTVRYNQNEHWATMSFLTEDNVEVYVLGTFEVEGNKLIFTPLDYFLELRDENQYWLGFEYTKGEDSMEFTFAFSGLNLTLTRDGQSVTLRSQYFCEDYNPRIGGYLVQGSEAAAGLDNFYAADYSDMSSAYVQLQGEDIYTSERAIAMSEDGWIAFYWVEYYYDDSGEKISTTHKEEFVYFPGNGFSCVLTDGENVYYYNDSVSIRNANQLSGNVSEADKDKLNDMSEGELKELAEKQANLLDDLAAAYETAGLNVTVNEETGEIALDAAVLFDVNESEISDEGKAFLQQFIQVYTSVVFSDEYDNFVSKIMVEGHTDTSGSYELNQTLSQARADSVKAYCLSDECAVEADAEKLTQMLEAVGYAYDKPIYDADGNVDMDASRRVSFRFIINLNQ